MAKRAGWENLSPAQRARYLGAGRRGSLSGEPYLDAVEVRAYYESGGDLGGGRGHKRARPSWAAPLEPTYRAKVNLLSTPDRKALDKWRRSRVAPKWMPRSPSQLRTDVAAILSEIDVGPERWTSVTVTPRGNGRYSLSIHARGREHDFETVLPDWDAVSDLGRLLNDAARMRMVNPKSAEGKQLAKEWKSDRDGVSRLHIAVDISDTDTEARKENQMTPMTTPVKGPKALPKRKKAKK